MQVTTIDHVDVAPGLLLRWSLDTSALTPRRSPVPPSFNQLSHLCDTDDGNIWLAATFDVPGPIDRDALALAYEELIRRHGSLRSAFGRSDSGELDRLVFDDVRVVLDTAASVRTETSEQARCTLWDALNTACHPFAAPAYLLAALDRADRSTVVCGFDHAYIDAYSVSLIVRDLHLLYRAATENGARNPAALDVVGDFVDYCAEEWSADIVAADDARMQSWLAFFDGRDNTPPSFPLDLGVPLGTTRPQAVELRRLLDDAHTHRFDEFCRAAAGASIYAGMLSAMAVAVHRMGGGPHLSLLFPLHTRTDPRWRSSVGWFTTNAPLTVVSEGNLTETVRSTGPALRQALKLGSVPLPQVIDALGGLNRPRKDIFMVSYVDYRTLPGHEDHRTLSARHISNVTVADDAQFWISRTDGGLAVRCRFPDTDTARDVVSRFLDEVTTILDSTLADTEVPAVVH